MTIRTGLAAALGIAVLLALPTFAASERPMLFQEPSISDAASFSRSPGTSGRPP